MMKYGVRIKELIKVAGYGQNEFAEKIGVSSSKMSFWCNSEYPPLEAIELVCNKLDIPIYKFFTTDEDLKNLTGIDPMLIKIGQWIDHMPDNVQIEIFNKFNQILELIEVSVDAYKKILEKNLEDRRLR